MSFTTFSTSRNNREAFIRHNADKQKRIAKATSSSSGVSGSVKIKLDANSVPYLDLTDTSTANAFAKSAESLVIKG